MLNRTRSKYILTSSTDSSLSSKLNQFTVVQRSAFILSLIALFWIIFLLIYLCKRLVVRFVKRFKFNRIYYSSSSSEEAKICRAFVISSHQYGSFHPRNPRSTSIYRCDSFYSHVDHLIASEQIRLPIDYRNFRQNDPNIHVNNASLLHHYLQTYNPLQIDLTSIKPHEPFQTIEKTSSETDSFPVMNCYGLNCNHRRKIHQGESYRRLKETNVSIPRSSTISLYDDQISNCSTTMTLDCSNEKVRSNDQQ